MSGPVGETPGPHGRPLSIREVMRRTGRDRTAVERWVRSGALKSARPDWRYIVFEEDLDRFLERHRYKPNKPPKPERRWPQLRLSLDAARARRDRAVLEVRFESRRPLPPKKSRARGAGEPGKPQGEPN
jgi:hypothetical protein